MRPPFRTLATAIFVGVIVGVAVPATVEAGDPPALREEIDRLERELESRESEAVRLRETTRALNESVVAERSEKRAAENEVVRLQRDAARERLEAARAASELESVRGELRAMHRAASEQRSEAAARIETLESELRRAQERRRAAEGRAGDLERDLAEARETAAAARGELDAMRGAVAEQHRTAEREIQGLERELRTAREAEQELRVELAGLHERNEQIGEQMAKLRHEAERVHELETRLELREFRIQELEGSNENARTQVRDLRIEKRRLEEMIQQVSQRREESVETLRALVARRVAEEPVAVATTTEVAPDDEASRDLRQRLDLELERRRTLEQEVQRLNAAVKSSGEFRTAWKELQTARAEILVLTNRLAEEREQRQEIELLLEEAREVSGEDGAAKEAVRKLVDLSRERKKEAERLERELHDANEMIVRLKGRLEAVGTPEENAQVLAELESQNARLRDDLSRARDSVARLREQAELAERLADLVYAKD